MTTPRKHNSSKIISTLLKCSVMIGNATSLLNELPEDVHLSRIIDDLSTIVARLEDAAIDEDASNA